MRGRAGQASTGQAAPVQPRHEVRLRVVKLFVACLPKRPLRWTHVVPHVPHFFVARDQHRAVCRPILAVSKSSLVIMRKVISGNPFQSFYEQVCRLHAVLGAPEVSCPLLLLLLQLPFFVLDESRVCAVGCLGQVLQRLVCVFAGREAFPLYRVPVREPGCRYVHARLVQENIVDILDNILTWRRQIQVGHGVVT